MNGETTARVATPATIDPDTVRPPFSPQQPHKLLTTPQKETAPAPLTANAATTAVETALPTAHPAAAAAPEAAAHLRTAPTATMASGRATANRPTLHLHPTKPPPAVEEVRVHPTAPGEAASSMRNPHPRQK